MNDTERLYEITKLTKSALTTVEKGWTPYSEYRQIVAIIEDNTKYRKWEDFKKSIKHFFKTMSFFISCSTAFCYAFRALDAFMRLETFWPGFGYVLIASIACSMGVFLYRDLWE